MFEYKERFIKTDPTFPSMHIIRPKGSGKVPAELSGRYTSVVEARLAIDRYNPPRGKTNAKAKPTAGNK